MQRMTALSAGGNAEVAKVRMGSTSSVEENSAKSKGSRRGSATEEVIKANKGRRGSSGEVFNKNKKNQKKQVVADRHTLHEAYYFLIETYVDKQESK